MAPANTTQKSPLQPGRFDDRNASLPSQYGPVLFLVFIFFVNFISRIILSPLLPTIERELAISHGPAGFLFLLISVGYVTGLVGSGFLASRSSHRITITVSTTGIGLALLGIASADGLWAIRLGLFGLGVASGLYIPSAIATITSLVERSHWGKAIAVHELAPNLAFFASPFVAELFLDWSGWRLALGCLGATALVAGLAYWQFGQGGDFAGESPASSASGVLVRSRAFWIMAVLFGLGVSATIGVYAMLPLYLVFDRHLDASWANKVVAVSRSYGPILGILGGWISDRLGPKQTMVISLIFTGIVTVLLGLAATVWISAVVLIQPLLAVWFFPAAFAALAATTPAAARNLAVAFTVPFGYLVGGGVIPALIGIIADAGSFEFGFVITGTLILSSGVLALFLKLPGAEMK